MTTGEQLRDQVVDRDEAEVREWIDYMRLRYIGDQDNCAAAKALALLDAKDAEIAAKSARVADVMASREGWVNRCEDAEAERDEALAKVAELEKQLKTVLDRESDSIRRHDAKVAEMTAAMVELKREVVETINEAEQAALEQGPTATAIVRHYFDPLRTAFLPTPAEPDRLVEAMRDACEAQGMATKHTPGELTEHLRQALARRGGKVVFGEVGDA